MEGKPEGKTDEMKERLDEVSVLIKKVYLPLFEGKADLRLHMDKFVKQVAISMQQAYGNITIRIPDLPENAPSEDLCNDRQLIEELSETIVSYLSPYPFTQMLRWLSSKVPHNF